MNIFNVIGNFFMEGGFFMYPVLLVAALGTAIVIERTLYITRASANGESIWKQVKNFLADQKTEDAIKLCQSSTRPIYHVLLAGLKAAKPTASREPIQRSMEEAMLEVLPPLERRTAYLPILANVATLLGLLGTIVGVIGAFAAVSAADPSQKAVLLARGISVALNMTAFGLIVAVPLILFYAFLQARTTKIIDAIDQYSTKLTNFYANRETVAAPERKPGNVASVPKTNPAS
ncbi:MAG: MotA/TolQ/ExbB proton channel family protein [Nitrospirae bacterium]|nr:MotA/TolQ/ExbB proton channel family protein [Nitrospirota bacterium]